MPCNTLLPDDTVSGVPSSAHFATTSGHHRGTVLCQHQQDEYYVPFKTAA